MKLGVTQIACLAACLSAGKMSPVAAAEKPPVIVVRGPTVVAFFEPITQAELQRNPDTNDALSDFQFYATRVREPLGKAGIAFHELYARSFRLRIQNRSITFRPVKVTVGYYLIAPGKEPRVEYGVITDADLVKVAKEYFGASRPAD